MITTAFAVYDGKGQFYGVPFFMPQVGLAVRAFADLANDPNTTVYKHPGDFTLYEIGSFDDSTGEMKSIVPHRLLGHASDFRPTVEGKQLTQHAIVESLPGNGRPVETVVSDK